MLEIKDLKAGFKGGEILKGVSLKVNMGEVHSIMGPNGSGKSTLSKVLVGHPAYTVSSGSVTLKGKSLLEMDPEDRSTAGLFLAYQYPVEVPGVNNVEFLRMAYNAKLKSLGKEEVDPLDFEEIIDSKMKMLNMDSRFKERAVNEGFSGGEKKKNEILQMAVLDPIVSILDEIDSGLDIDALKTVAEGVNKLRSKNNAIVVITHFPRILEYIKPDHVHVFSGGKIVKSGDSKLAHELEISGYDGYVNSGAVK